jgi:Primase X
MIIQSLDLLLSHFLEPIWPRYISTKDTGGAQILVHNKEEAQELFEKARWLDCRISAYPPNVTDNSSALDRFRGSKTVTPKNIIVIIDLDRCNFKTDRALEMALSKTLDNIKQKLEVSSPTVIWSGNGYHIYLVLDSNGINLENVKQFAELDIKNRQLSLRFLRFAEWYLSNGKSDRSHNTTVSYNNSMMRVPGSYNSKNGAKVRVVQEWHKDGDNPTQSILPLLLDFRHYLIEEKVKERSGSKRVSLRHNSDINTNETLWIERLLNTPLDDRRKYCIWRILTPYLLNIRRLPEPEIIDIMENWLDKCNQLRRLDFNSRYRIREGIKGASVGYLPVAFNKLKEESPELYELIEFSSAQP